MKHLVLHICMHSLMHSREVHKIVYKCFLFKNIDVFAFDWNESFICDTISWVSFFKSRTKLVPLAWESGL